MNDFGYPLVAVEREAPRLPAKLREAGPPYPLWTTDVASPPHRPVRAGTDVGDEPLFVGRAWHGPHLLPAKVAPAHRGAFVAWEGRELSKFHSQFEVLHLARGSADWVPASNGVIPPYAYPVGMMGDGREAYMARVAHEDTITPGRLLQGDQYCYISFGGEEIAYTNYEVLIIK